MKVLSLTEPYATLIKNNKKKIETRSWKTSYRGELYIHASETKIPSKSEEDSELMSLVKDSNLNFGYIICKCNLVDCVLMTKEYINIIKTNHPLEYLCGVYEEGRYAWILEDVEVLNIPIKAHGQLNIWNYYNEYEILTLMDNIEYGWVDTLNHSHDREFELMFTNYHLQTPQEIIKNKVGVCWDQVELERFYFKPHTMNTKTFFIVHYDNNECPTHTFLTYEKDNKYYWFEHSWEVHRGIHEYPSLDSLLKDVRSKFIIHELNNNYNSNNLVIYEYSKPKYHLSVTEFISHCEQGIKISLN